MPLSLHAAHQDYIPFVCSNVARCTHGQCDGYEYPPNRAFALRAASDMEPFEITGDEAEIEMTVQYNNGDTYTVPGVQMRF